MSGKDAWLRWGLIAAGIYAGYVIFLAPKGTPLIPFGLGGPIDTTLDYATGEPAQSGFGGIAVNPVTGWGYNWGYETAAATGTDVTSLDRILVG